MHRFSKMPPQHIDTHIAALPFHSIITHNLEHGITPHSAVKRFKGIIDGDY
jgi:hypothetical protein